MADDILALFPAHGCYVEVFGGAASVLLSKAPATLDVYNDLDDGLVNFFRVLRDAPERIVPLLELTPYARSEWEEARNTWFKVEDPVERARRWYVVAAGSFGAMTAKDNQHPNGERAHGRGWGGEKLGRMHLSRAASSANRVDSIWRFVERMRLVQIDNLDWRACLTRYDSPDCLFYLDPPYVSSTRRAGGYQHEMTDADHEELVDRILGLAGVAIVSGYSHPIYERLTDEGYTRHEHTVWSTAGQLAADRARDKRQEVLWASPRAAQPTLFHDAKAAMA